MASFVDETLLRDFLADSREHLGAIEPDLLALESEGAAVDSELINRLFRAIHSIKGFSVFLGFEKVTDLSHAMESLLMRFRDGVATPDPEKVDALLAGVDKLRAMIDDIKSSDQVSCQQEMARLRAALEGAISPAAPVPAPPPAPEEPSPQAGSGLRAPGGQERDEAFFIPGAASLEEVVAGDLSLYAVWLNLQQDLGGEGRTQEQFEANLESCGRCLSTDMHTPEAAGPWRHCLFATLIEEQDIAAVALELPVERLHQFSGEQVRAALAAARAQAPEAGQASAAAPAAKAQAPLISGSLREVDSGPGPEGLRHSFQVDTQDLMEALDHELNLFAVWVHVGRDLGQDGRTAAQFMNNLASCGRCLAGDLAEDAPPAGPWANCLFATLIEESEIAAMALELPEEQVVAVPRPSPEAAPSSPPAATPPRPTAPPAAQPPVAQTPAGPEPLKAAPMTIETIRVSVPLIDKLINLAGEMVLGRNRLRRQLDELSRKRPDLGSILQKVDLVTSDLQENIMQLRMQPVGSIFNKFPRVVRDLSRQLAKEVELVVQGGEVELDKSILEQLSDPLTHLIRNSVDHGIEPPAERLAQGKPRQGRIVLKAFHEEGQVNITVSDDGRGMDAEAVAAKAVKAGLIRAEEAARLSSGEKLKLITMPGVSTAQKVTDISGRGVGMDVVATNIQKISGHLEIDSQVGQGAVIRLRLPLTLAIIPSLVVGAGGQVYAIPQVDVQELVCIQAQAAAQRIELVGDAPVVRLRERLLPLVRLRDVLGLARRLLHPATGQEMKDRRQRIADRRREAQAQGPPTAAAAQTEQRQGRERRRRHAEDIYVVVLRVGSNRYGLIVDELFDTEEIVVKPLSRHIKDCRCFGGTTIMGDGRVAMILDAAGIANHAQLRFSEIQAAEARYQEEQNRRRLAAAGPTMSLVLFKYAAQEYFALPLTSVARLELIKPELIQPVGGRECVQYRGSGLSLLRLDRHLPVGRFPREVSQVFLIIPKNGRQEVGIVASAIVDIVETDAALREYEGPHRGLAGLLNLDGRLTLLLEAGELVDAFKQDEPMVDAPLFTEEEAG